MLKDVRLFLCSLVFICPMISHAQSDFFFNLYGCSTNFWSNFYMQLPTSIINGLIMDVDELDNEDVSYSFGRVDFLSLKDDGRKIKLDNNYWGNTFGFKATEMFRNFQYGFKFGWQPVLSPFGIFVSCAYQHRQFKARLDENDDKWSKFRFNYIRPGVGIRVTPLIRLLENYGWSPILEIGTAYNYNFSCKAPYDNSKDQFNDGLTTTVGLGVRFEKLSITSGAEIDNYNLFNQDFTPDNGQTYPYKNLKTKHFIIYVSVSRDF